MISTQVFRNPGGGGVWGTLVEGVCGIPDGGVEGVCGNPGGGFYFHKTLTPQL